MIFYGLDWLATVGDLRVLTEALGKATGGVRLVQRLPSDGAGTIALAAG